LGNYVEQVVEELAELLPDCEPDLIRMYALLALVLGGETTERDVHDAWALWRHATNPRHRSLVPFNDLAADVQAMDIPYAQAIRAVAAAG
jgi:hypothetical protein